MNYFGASTLQRWPIHTKGGPTRVRRHQRSGVRDAIKLPLLSASTGPAIG